MPCCFQRPLSPNDSECGWSRRLFAGAISVTAGQAASDASLRLRTCLGEAGLGAVRAAGAAGRRAIRRRLRTGLPPLRRPDVISAHPRTVGASTARVLPPGRQASVRCRRPGAGRQAPHRRAPLRKCPSPRRSKLPPRPRERRPFPGAGPARDRPGSPHLRGPPLRPPAGAAPPSPSFA